MKHKEIYSLGCGKGLATKGRLRSSVATVAGTLLCLGGGLAATTAQADDEDFGVNLSGYVRTIVATSLSDHPETASNDKWDIPMARGTVYLDLDVFTGPLTWKAVGRFDKEVKTGYLKNLEALTQLQSPGGNFSDDFMDQYDTSNVWEFLREFYVDFTLFDRLDVRLGKQQLVWGESDFFQAMDLIHGFDYRWRLFFENNEDWRKPLVLANFNLDVSEWDGALNFFIRPGLDRAEDMGSNFNLEGGRWIPHPYRGVDFTAFNTAYNTDHNRGDWDDVTFGARWTGSLGSIGYSLAYLKTFNPAPIVNPATIGNLGVLEAFGVTSTTPYGEVASNQVLGDWIYPKIDVFGASVNGFVSALDATLSAEVAFTPNKPFNFGQLESSLPGWGGIVEKDTLAIMLRVDKELKLSEWLGTNRPSLSSIQLFDTWIVDYESSNDVVEFFSFGAPKKKHTVYLTAFTLLNFKHDTINPSFVIGGDLSNGGGFLIPAVEFVMGDNWRVKFEADLWWGGDKKQPSAALESGAHLNPLGISENSASFFDWFAKDNQLVVKVTRQF
ncbi:MAG: hypothetical protein JKY34_03120 [Kordiimonadaceae bacterium]|nr:hypothetical protein [Kordiimonadaceae bacterium]